MKNPERLLVLFLRVVGSSSLLALVAVVMPYSWMDAIHQWLGLGKLPDTPIVGYLARSTSLFYALLGGLLWVVSFDPHRHRPVLCYLGAAVVFFGLTLLAVDLAVGLPFFWSLWEGPLDAALGIVILWLGCRIGRSPDPPQ